MENSIEFPQKSKNNYHKTQQSTHGDISKENRTVIQKDICTPMLMAALFTISQDMDTYPSMLVYFNEILLPKLSKQIPFISTFFFWFLSQLSEQSIV